MEVNIFLRKSPIFLSNSSYLSLFINTCMSIFTGRHSDHNSYMIYVINRNISDNINVKFAISEDCKIFHQYMKYISWQNFRGVWMTDFLIYIKCKSILYYIKINNSCIVGTLTPSVSLSVFLKLCFFWYNI